MKIAMLGYRDWAKSLFRKVEGRTPIDTWVYWHEERDQYFSDYDNYELVFLVGWSEIVPVEFHANRTVIVLHPSPLPKYRGGSPIQNQIIAGETESAVTLIKLDSACPAVDSGPIISQRAYSLEGNLSVILDRIADVGAILVKRAIEDFRDGVLTFTPQDESQATTFKRRQPRESEVRREWLNGIGFGQGLALHNRIRALQDPYPNAYLQFPDGQLYITQTRWEPNE